MTQFCIEEALFERLDVIDRRAKENVPDLAGPDFSEDGAVPGISPGQAQAAEHATRMAELRGA